MAKPLDLRSIAPEHRALFTIGLRSYFVIHIVAETEELEAVSVSEARNFEGVMREAQNVGCWPTSTEGRINTYIYPMGRHPRIAGKVVQMVDRNVLIPAALAVKWGWMSTGVVETISPEQDNREAILC